MNPKYLRMAEEVVMKPMGLHEQTCEQVGQDYSQGLCDCDAVNIIAALLSSVAEEERGEIRKLVEEYPYDIKSKGEVFGLLAGHFAALRQGDEGEESPTKA